MTTFRLSSLLILAMLAIPADACAAESDLKEWLGSLTSWDYYLSTQQRKNRMELMRALLDSSNGHAPCIARTATTILGCGHEKVNKVLEFRPYLEDVYRRVRLRSDYRIAETIAPNYLVNDVTMVFVLTVDNDGHLVQLRNTKSSGSDFFDGIVARLISMGFATEKCTPLKMPPHDSENQIYVEFYVQANRLEFAMLPYGKIELAQNAE